FRPISGDDVHFGVSASAPGIVSYSRILSEQEILIVANTNTQSNWVGAVIVDEAINVVGQHFRVLYSNQDLFVTRGAVLERNRRYTAEVSQDSALNTTTLSLSSTDQSNPSRNTLVSIAPEFGSNLFRFRAGEHDLIYTDQELLTKRDFTGTFVLWPFPNRVRDKRYTYQGQRYSLEDVHRPGGYPTLVHGLVFDRPWHYTQP